MTLLVSRIVILQGSCGDDGLQFLNHLGIHLVSSELLRDIGGSQVFEVAGHIAIELPELEVVEHTEQTGLSLIVGTLGGSDIACALNPFTIFQHIVRALHARITVAPDTCQTDHRRTAIVEHQLQHGLVSVTATVGIHIIAHELRDEVQGIVLIGRAIVVPVQGCVCCHQCLVERCLGGIVFLDESVGRTGHLKETVLTAGQSQGCKHSE